MSRRWRTINDGAGVANERLHRPSRARRGSAYVLILMVSMIVMVIGLSGVLTSRVQHRGAQATSEMAEARFYALSAIDMGLYLMQGDPSVWRNNFKVGILPTDMSIGNGTMSLVAVDPVDGDFANNIDDPVVLSGIGISGAARHKAQVTIVFTGATPDFEPGSWKQVVD